MNLNVNIERLAKGDKKAFKDIYEYHKHKWYSICLRYQASRDDANESLQNSLIKIFNKIALFDKNKGDFGGWAYRIIVNENLQLLRKKDTRVRYTENAIEDFHIFPEDESKNNPSAKELTKMIQKLPEGYRNVFNLYVLEGLTHNEISNELNISVGTSKSQLSKAKRMLRNKLEQIYTS